MLFDRQSQAGRSGAFGAIRPADRPALMSRSALPSPADGNRTRANQLDALAGVLSLEHRDQLAACQPWSPSAPGAADAARGGSACALHREPPSRAPVWAATAWLFSPSASARTRIWQRFWRPFPRFAAGG